MRTDFIWFKVEVPEGVEITDVAGDTADRAQFKFTESEHASDRFIPVFDSDKNADELFDYEAKWNASFEWTENDPVKYNGKTWRNASYTPVSYTHLDVYKRQAPVDATQGKIARPPDPGNR